MTVREKSPSSVNSMQRVKVYRLSVEGKWEDRGTGHVSVDTLERTGELGLFVVDEEENDTLLIHRISSDEIYRRQEDTIISWRDPEYSTELALSFQEITGCSYVWDQICEVQRSMHFGELSSPENRSRLPADAHGSAGLTQANDRVMHVASSELQDLPPLELSTLPLILKTIVENGVTDHVRVVELILHEPDFFRKLIDVFQICEDLENVDALHMIFKIVKGIIMLNNPQLLDRMLGDDFIMDIIGCLEYDPDVREVQHHRAFIKEHVIFKEAVPIKDPVVLSKIHQSYRVGYIKDVILPRVLDDGTTTNLNSVVHANNAVVVSLLKDDAYFIHEFFVRMKSSSLSGESRKNMVLFLNEFCSVSKSLQLVQQLRLFRDLVNEGIFDIITNVLQSEDKKLVLIGTDILLLFLNQDPNLLRTFIVQQEENVLFGLLVKGMLTDFGADMHCQFVEIIRILLDSYTLSGSQKDNIVEIFYDKYLGQLIDVVVVSCPPKGKLHGKEINCETRAGMQAPVPPEILLNICELFCFCVIHHPYRVKCSFLVNNAIEKVLLLTRRRERYLVVAAVRFVRAIISRNDEHLFRHIIRNNLLKPVIEAFIHNGARYNLLHSVILELFDYMRKENFKLLIQHVVETFWEQLGSFEHFGVLNSLKIKYEQLMETCEMRSTASVVDPRRRMDDRALEKEEEDYFNEDSEEEDSASVQTHRTRRVTTSQAIANGSSANYPSFRIRTGLVDYDDDDDDDVAYNPPSISKQGVSASLDDAVDSPSKLKRGPSLKGDANGEEGFELAKKRRHERTSINTITIVPPCSACKLTSSSRNTSPAIDVEKVENHQIAGEMGSTHPRNCANCSGDDGSRHSEDSVCSSSGDAVR